MVIRGLPCAVCLLLASIAAAQTTMPDATPSTQPTDDPSAMVDQSTPHGAIELWFIVSGLNDADGIRSVLYAENPEGRRLIYALAAEADAQRRMEAAEKTAFPSQYQDQTPQIKAALMKLIPLLSAGQETIDGDDATYTRNAQSKPIMLRRYQGRWCLPIDSIFTPHDPASLAFGQRMTDASVRAMELGISQIEGGKFVSLTEAQDTINNEIQESRAEAQTQPSDTQ
jgi:hypothetical protein